MSLKNWLKNGWLKSHKTSKQEIENLFNIVKRDLKDAQRPDVSADWKFGIAYNAALKLCTILMYAEGYRPENSYAHYRTIQALPLILGNERSDDTAYLEACRVKRNIVEYDYVGSTSETEAKELIKFVKDLQFEVQNWIKKHYPEYI
ncbi:MAG: hypothetical protein K9N05_00880 [Candidatus Marinimicrobia bacterium]|nr:hypothetical protein [Candidatus Neomarinimicrobiota bacterium]